jgi:cytochrome c5
MPGAAVASSAAAGAAPAVDGEATYNGACMACHSTGAGGAPMVGNEEAWAPRIAKGMDALYNSGLNGVAGGAMLAKGGRADLSDAAVKAAVDYMVSNSQ